MSRSVVTYAVLLVAALVATYLTWTSEPETRVSDGVVIAEFTADEVERIEYDAPKKRVVVSAKSEGEDRYWWVEETRRVEVSESDGPSSPHESADDSSAPPDAGHDAGSADAGSADAGTTGAPDAGADAGDPGTDDEPKTKTKHLVYKASGIFERRFIENIGPLHARRKLPDPSAERRKAYGFDGETKKLVITTTDGTHTFTIGAHTYGRQHVYLRDEKSGDYFVVDVGLIGPFKFSETRLREERVTDADEESLKAVALQSDGRSARLVRHNRDDPTAAYWSFGDKTERNKTAQSWIAKLLRVRVDRYFARERPEGLAPRLVVRLELTDGSTTTVEFFERQTGDTTKYFAESDFTKRYVQLERSAASTLLADLSTLFEAADPDAGN